MDTTTVGDEARPRLQALDHIGILVRDADQSMRYYREKLGLELAHDEELTDIAVRLVYLQTATPGAMLQLVQPTGPGAMADHLDAHGEGLHHVCFGVTDITTTLNGLPGEMDAEVFRGGRGQKACFLVSQPSGVLVELTEIERGGDRSRLASTSAERRSDTS